MSEIVFFLEEPSAEAMLRGLLPRLLSADVTCRFVVFEGKQDLDKQMVRRMRGYKMPDAKFVILRDQDDGDCKKIKQKIQEMCIEAGKQDALVRIACRELESWYLADLIAVENALQRQGLGKKQDKTPYRTPDNVAHPSRLLARIAPGYQKIGGSRMIGPLLDLKNTRSKSFAHFVSAVQRLADKG